MSRLAVTFISLLALLFGSSCVPSVHGIATESNIIFKPELVGSWIPDDGGGAWIFESEDDRGYLLTLETPEGTDGSFHVAMVDLDGELFLDLFPSDSDPSWPINSFYGLHFLPMHTFMNVAVSEDSLSLRMMDPSWLDAWLASNPDGTSYEKESFTMLTGNTAELQAWLPTLLDAEPIAGSGMMGNDSTAFTEPALMKRGEMSMAGEGMDEMESEDAMPTTMP